jgi:hypothetical protein
MLTRGSKVAVAVLVVANLVGIVGPAIADTDPQVVTLNRAANLSYQSSFLDSAAKVNGCTWRGSRRTAYFSTGAVAWWTQLRGNWCWGSGKVKSASWAKSFDIGDQWYNQWEWIRWEGTVTGGGVGTGHVYRRVTGHLKVCLIISLGTVCDHREPWTALTLRGDGTASASSGG